MEEVAVRKGGEVAVEVVAVAEEAVVLKVAMVTTQMAWVSREVAMTY